MMATVKDRATLDRCKHLNCTIRGYDLRGDVHCLDCGITLPLWVAVNNLMAEMRRLIKEAKRDIP